MITNFPPGTSHEDATGTPIAPGDFIFIFDNSHYSCVKYGFVTELILRTGEGAVKMRVCESPHRRYTGQVANTTEYKPKVYNGSTKKLYKLVVVNRSVINPVAADLLTGLTKTPTAAEILSDLDNL